MTEKILTLLLFAFGAGYLYLARQLAFGSLLNPQAGFMPTLEGVVAVATALFLLYQQLQNRDSPAAEAANWTIFLFIMIGFSFYILLFKIIGYFASTFIFLFFLIKIADMSGWRTPFGVALASSTVLYLVFKHYLDVTLP